MLESHVHTTICITLNHIFSIVRFLSSHQNTYNEGSSRW